MWGRGERGKKESKEPVSNLLSKRLGLGETGIRWDTKSNRVLIGASIIDSVVLRNSSILLASLHQVNQSIFQSSPRVHPPPSSHLQHELVLDSFPVRASSLPSPLGPWHHRWLRASRSCEPSSSPVHSARARRSINLDHFIRPYLQKRAFDTYHVSFTSITAQSNVTKVDPSLTNETGLPYILSLLLTKKESRSLWYSIPTDTSPIHSIHSIHPIHHINQAHNPFAVNRCARPKE